MANTQTVLSKEPEARRRPSQLQSTEWTLEECDVYSRVFSFVLNFDCSSLSSDDALDEREEAEEENDDVGGGATEEAADLDDEDEAGGMMDELMRKTRTRCSTTGDVQCFAFAVCF